MDSKHFLSIRGWAEGTFFNSVSELMTEFSNQQNATLIEQNEKLRDLIHDAIDMYENRGIDIPEKWIDKAFKTLKNTADGK